MSWRLGLGLVALLLVALFAAQNSGNVVITFLNLQAEAPLSVVILVTFSIGMAVLGLISTWRQFFLNRRIRQQQSLINELENELKSFRNTAIPEDMPPNVFSPQPMVESEPLVAKQFSDRTDRPPADFNE